MTRRGVIDEVLDKARATPMDPDVKREWVEALRSGEYEQGMGSLKREDDESGDKVLHCCLGVLCELYAKQYPEARWEFNDEEGRIGFVDVIGSSGGGTLTEHVSQWSGIYTADGEFAEELTEEEKDMLDEFIDCGNDRIEYNLAALNDRGCSFLEIARIIERVF